MRRALLLLSLLLVLAPATTRAATEFPLPLASARSQPEIVSDWTKRILRSRDDVQRGEFAKARHRTERVVKEMLLQVKRGRTARILLGSAAYVRALAEAGEGQDADAIWDASVAFALAPELRGYEPAFEGPASARLQTLFREEQARYEGCDCPESESREADDPEFTPPRKLEAPPPVYPPGKMTAGVQARISVRAVIDELGLLRLPTLVEGDDPSLIYSGLEALREWRFAPAQAEGKPVPVHYNLTINYRLAGAPGPT